MPRTTDGLKVLCLLLAAGKALAQDRTDGFAPVARLLQSRCAMPACHGGSSPAAGMSLEGDRVYRSTVNIPARTDRRFLRVAPRDPGGSLLYLKLLSPHEGGYRGPRMPLSMDPLGPELQEQIRGWIESFPEELWGDPRRGEREERRPRSFQDGYLSNLPTPDTLGARTMDFRIAHRFKASAPDAGSHGLYGLDSGAWISLELAYGPGDTVDVGLRRTNLNTDYEGYLKWGPIRQAPDGFPLSLAVRGSVSSVRETDRVNRTRWAGQAILARRFGDGLSLMLVPTYVTHTHDLDAGDSRGTAAIGAGMEWHLSPHRALTGEWIVQTSGVEAAYQSASVGFSMATNRHVFHLMVTNTRGHLTDLYAPGGDLDLGDGQFRLGFNISRTFAFHPPPSAPSR